MSTSEVNECLVLISTPTPSSTKNPASVTPSEGLVAFSPRGRAARRQTIFSYSLKYFNWYQASSRRKGHSLKLYLHEGGTGPITIVRHAQCIDVCMNTSISELCRRVRRRGKRRQAYSVEMT